MLVIITSFILLESAPERSTKSGEIGRLGSSHKKYMTDVKERDRAIFR